MRGTAADLADATPATRDRYVDLLRAASILVVVLGHYLIAVVYHRPGERIWVENAVGRTSGLWLATWVLQVMPVFFFVGGFANMVSWKGRYGAFLRGRLARLLRPFGVFVAVWGVVEVALHLLDVGAGGFFRLTRLPFGPLWFLGVYLAVVALAPPMLRLHRAAPLATVAALGAAVVAVDVLRFALDVRGIGWANLAFVWLFVHQLGFLYADGTLPRLSRARLTALAAVGLAGMAVLTNVGGYPRSMVGVDHESVSNMSPPTVCIAFLALWQVGLVMLLRPALTRRLAGRRTWTLVVAANGMVMTVFLWHLTALVLTVLLLGALGLDPEPDTTAAWWLGRPLWVLLPLAVTAALVAVFGRAERPRR